MSARPRRLTRTQRRLLVTLHVALSVGWLGASVAMLALAIAAGPGAIVIPTAGAATGMAAG